jgi:hypothetical protein
MGGGDDQPLAKINTIEPATDMDRVDAQGIVGGIDRLSRGATGRGQGQGYEKQPDRKLHGILE